jgi:hypothetical protein
MLIRFFRSSFLIQYLALIIIGVTLWIPAFINPPVNETESSLVSPLYHFITGLLPDIAWLPVLIALLLVFTEAIILNIIFIYHDLVPKNSLLPALLFTLFMSSGAQFITLYPALLATFPLIFFLHQVYLLFEESENLNRTLSIGILAALSSLLYAPMLLLIFYIWIVFLIYRMLHWREWFISVIGFVLPYLYLGVYYFWLDKLQDFYDEYIDYTVNIFQFTATADIFQIAIWIIFALLLVLPSVVKVLSTMGSHNIAFRRKMSATVWMALFAAFMIITQGDIGSNNILYLPAAGIVAYHFHSVKKSAWNELVVLSYLILIGVHNYLMA